MSYSQTIQGARCAFKITTPTGEKTVAFATGVNYNISHEHSPVFVLDRLAAVEYAPTAYSCSISCTTFRVPGKSSIGQGFQKKLEDILTQDDLIVTIYDRNGDQPILTISGVKFVGRSGGIAARGEMSETWEFVGLMAWDESGR